MLIILQKTSYTLPNVTIFSDLNYAEVSFPSSISSFFFLSPLNLICLFQISTVLPIVTVTPDKVRSPQKEQGLLFLLTEVRCTNVQTVSPHP